jgi:hypothetical protein
MVGDAVALGHDVDETFAGLPEVARGLRDAIENGEVWVSGPQTVGANTASPHLPARTYVFTALPLYDGGDASGIAVFAQDVSGRRA